MTLSPTETTSLLKAADTSNANQPSEKTCILCQNTMTESYVEHTALKIHYICIKCAGIHHNQKCTFEFANKQCKKIISLCNVQNSQITTILKLHPDKPNKTDSKCIKCRCVIL